MNKAILICIGVMASLTLHPVWGRVAAALTGIFIAVLLVRSANTKWRFLLILAFPALCFLGVTYAGGLFSSWLNENTPEKVMGDVVYYFREAGIAAVPALEGTKALIQTGEPDALAVSGMKMHYLFIFIVSVAGAFFFLFLDSRKISASLRRKGKDKEEP